jgi:hypothetical protein
MHTRYYGATVIRVSSSATSRPSNDFYGTLKAKLSKDYEMTDTPAAGAMRIRLISLAVAAAVLGAPVRSSIVMPRHAWAGLSTKS